MIPNQDLPAFPTINADRGIEHGLTKREYVIIEIAKSICINAERNGFNYNHPNNIAEKAVEITDAILKTFEPKQDGVQKQKKN